MDLGLEGKTTLVTGASTGIGKGVTAALHGEGCHVHMVSRSLDSGVRVLAVSPGPVGTDRLVNRMRTRAEAEFGDAERWPQYFANLPGKRAATVEEIADVVTFMASPRAGFVSGTVVTVDGGHGGDLASFA